MTTAVLAVLRAYAGSWDRAVELYGCHLLGRTPGPRWVLIALEQGTRLCQDCNRTHLVCAQERVSDTCPTCGSFQMVWVDARRRPVDPPHCERATIPAGACPSYSSDEYGIDFSRWAEREHGWLALACLVLTRIGTHEAPPMSYREAARRLGCDDHTCRAKVKELRDAWQGKTPENGGGVRNGEAPARSLTSA